MKICQACKTTWGDGDTPDYCPTCLTPITDWHGLYLGMDELCRQQQQRASTAEQRLREVETALRYLFDSTAEDGQWEESGVHNFVKVALAPERTVDNRLRT